MADIASSAFAVFFTQCPSFLSFQQNMEKNSGRNNARSLFHIERIPCDNHIRQTLDPIAPAHLFDFFDDLHQGFADAGWLAAMRAVQQTRLIALDATWYFSSQSKNVCCPNCSCLKHTDGHTTHFHSAITPGIVNGVPLTDRDDALQLNWCELTLTDADGKVTYRNAFITDWAITADNVAGLVAAGRARWKIENENNNVLKHRGYHLEHNFGHGKQPLSSLLLTLNLLALALPTFLEVTDESYRLVRAAVGARRKFFAHLEAVTAYWFFESWERLMDFMMRGQEVGPYAAQKS